MRTIQGFWDSYEKEVLPADAPPIQRKECRRAFYAGAQAMMIVFTSIGEPSISEDAGVALIEGFNSELASFAARVGIDA